MRPQQQQQQQHRRRSKSPRMLPHHHRPQQQQHRHHHHAPPSRFLRWTQVIVGFIALDILFFLLFVNSHHTDENVHEMPGQMLHRRQRQSSNDHHHQPEETQRRNLSERHESLNEEDVALRGIEAVVLPDDENDQDDEQKPPRSKEEERGVSTTLVSPTNNATTDHLGEDGDDDDDDDETTDGESAFHATNTTTTTVATTTTLSYYANMTPRVVPDRQDRYPWNLRHETIDRYTGRVRSVASRVNNAAQLDPHASNFIRPDSIVTDPLRNRFWKYPRRPVTYDIALPYLGILVDGGRHYYPVAWLERLIDYLSAMRYNLIHLRLTDDQAFNVLLESHPELAGPPAVNNPDRRVWTADELRHVVRYARRRNVSVMPEINVPGHGGAWAGVPGLISACPRYLCERGYSVPLNVSHPAFLPVLQDVLNETLRIFDDPPFLHLGGDEVDMARPCFEELGEEMYDYPAFEVALQGILDRLGYPAEQVVRWEMTNSWQRITPMYCGVTQTYENTTFRRCNATDVAVRAGGIEQFWESYPYERHNPTPRIFLSNRLYLDTNNDQNARDVYRFAEASFFLRKDIVPTALIVGGFELSTQFWYDRNVLGRLLGVSLGLSRPELPERWSAAREEKYIYDQYKLQCERVGLGPAICESRGAPLIPTRQYRSVWEQGWRVWKAAICERTTYAKTFMEFKPGSVLSASATRRGTDPSAFWEVYGNMKAPLRGTDNITGSEDPKPNNGAETTNIGVIVDTTSSLISYDRMKELLSTFHELKFDTMQLTLAGDRGFTFESEVQNTLPFSMLDNANHRRSKLYDKKFLRYIDRVARRHGIEIIPEISFKTNAAGWFGAGMLAQCPQHFCKGGSVASDITIPTLLPVVFSVLSELLDCFSSRYLHLGHDEREASQACYDEAGIGDVRHDRFESKLRTLLEFGDISDEYVLRYQNTENKEYKERAGQITHYPAGFNPDEMETDDPFFVNVDVLDGSAFQVYERTRYLMELGPTGILAELRHLEVEQWEDYQIAERLLAFALGSGAHPDEDHTEHTFGEAFYRLCKEMKSADFVCKEIPGPIANVVHVTETEDWTKAHCGLRTTETEKYFFREHIPPIFNETMREQLLATSELLEVRQTLPPLTLEDMTLDNATLELLNATLLSSTSRKFEDNDEDLATDGERKRKVIRHEAKQPKKKKIPHNKKPKKQSAYVPVDGKAVQQKNLTKLKPQHHHHNNDTVGDAFHHYGQRQPSMNTTEREQAAAARKAHQRDHFGGNKKNHTGTATQHNNGTAAFLHPASSVLRDTTTEQREPTAAPTTRKVHHPQKNLRHPPQENIRHPQNGNYTNTTSPHVETE